MPVCPNTGRLCMTLMMQRRELEMQRWPWTSCAPGTVPQWERVSPLWRSSRSPNPPLKAPLKSSPSGQTAGELSSPTSRSHFRCLMWYIHNSIHSTYVFVQNSFLLGWHTPSHSFPIWSWLKQAQASLALGGSKCLKTSLTVLKCVCANTVPLSFFFFCKACCMLICFWCVFFCELLSVSFFVLLSSVKVISNFENDGRTAVLSYQGWRGHHCVTQMLCLH